MNSKRQAGLTLIELILFIVIVSVGVVGILSVMNITVLHSADPMTRKQAAALADSIMEEILLKAYTDPDGVSGEATRDTFDDVSDYNGLTQTAFTSSLPEILKAYAINIEVVNGTTELGVTAKKVTVTVSSGAESISITGYRADY